MSCEVADNAIAAMEILRTATASGMPFSLALIDLNMPDVDGYELARAIRAQPALVGVRLILLSCTGNHSEAPEETARDGWVTKPVRQSRLYEAIQAAIAGEPGEAQRAQRMVEAQRANAPRRGVPPAVLVVEDTAVNQTVAARMLERCGFRAQVAVNGLRALEALSQGSYAAVLMDCQMPELDGYETTREVRRREQGGPRIPIIAMTANSMKGERERCLAAGMDDYLTKPLRNQVLKGPLVLLFWFLSGPDLTGFQTGEYRRRRAAEQLESARLRV